jgi:hypothetical protein
MAQLAAFIQQGVNPRRIRRPTLRLVDHVADRDSSSSSLSIVSMWRATL